MSKYLEYLESVEAKLVALKPLSPAKRKERYGDWWSEIAHDRALICGYEGLALRRLRWCTVVDEPTVSRFIGNELAVVREAIEVEREETEADSE